MKKIFYSMAVLMMGLAFTACSDSDNNNNNDDNQFNIITTAPQVDQDNYPSNTTDANYSNRQFGQQAIDDCLSLISQLEDANTTIATSKLSEEQEAYLRKVLETLVSNVIVPTYTQLADDVEDLESTLNGLTVNNITQTQIDKACADFKQARLNWERSEAFLMGAASDFDIDPTIDSWPLNRSLLLNSFNNGRNDAMLEDLLRICAPATRLCIAADITMPDETILTRSVAQWRKDPITLGKRPCVFLILA